MMETGSRADVTVRYGLKQALARRAIASSYGTRRYRDLPPKGGATYISDCGTLLGNGR